MTMQTAEIILNVGWEIGRNYACFVDSETAISRIIHEAEQFLPSDGGDPVIEMFDCAERIYRDLRNDGLIL